MNTNAAKHIKLRRKQLKEAFRDPVSEGCKLPFLSERKVKNKRKINNKNGYRPLADKLV